MSDYSTIYNNNDADSMINNWRNKDGDPYKNLIRNSNQLLFVDRFVDLRSPMTIVEYGCAFGDLLAIIKMLNRKHNIYGVEAVKEVANIAKQQIGNNTVFNQSCHKKISLKNDSVDLVLSFDMIEHLYDKEEFVLMLDECNRILKEYNFCIIITPNLSRVMKFIYKVTGNNYLIDKNFHPNQYDREILLKEISEKLYIVSFERGYDLNIFTRILSYFGIYKHLCVVARPQKWRI